MQRETGGVWWIFLLPELQLFFFFFFFLFSQGRRRDGSACVQTGWGLYIILVQFPFCWLLNTRIFCRQANNNFRQDHSLGPPDKTHCACGFEIVSSSVFLYPTEGGGERRVMMNRRSGRMGRIDSPVQQTIASEVQNAMEPLLFIFFFFIKMLNPAQNNTQCNVHLVLWDSLMTAKHSYSSISCNITDRCIKIEGIPFFKLYQTRQLIQFNFTPSKCITRICYPFSSPSIIH